MNRAAKQRALLVCSLLAAVFTVFSAKLVQLQVSEHAVYLRDEADKQVTKQPIYARRGTIMDTHGEPLAQNEPTRRVLADGSLIKDAAATARLLAGPLGMKVPELVEKLQRTKYSEVAGRALPCRYIVLKKDVPEANAQQIADFMTATKERGVIFQPDFAGVRSKPASENVSSRRVLVSPEMIDDPAVLANLLAGPLEMEASELTKTFDRKNYPASGKDSANRYIVVKEVPDAKAREIADIMGAVTSRSIFFEPDSIRRYPNNALLAHVIGFTNGENQGVDGIERTMNEYLSGHDGYRFIERDREGREIVLYRGQERAARNGSKVRLTIDMQLQNIVETELDAAMKQFQPHYAVCVMMRPQTGEILAMASRPTFNPNEINSIPKGVSDDPDTNPFINRAIASSYEPGSTFKIVATSAALNERLVRPDTTIFCENGYFARYKLKDSHAHGDLTVSEVLIKSSNIGVCKLAVQLGEQKYYEYVRKFGFGDQTGVDLPGEQRGILEPPYRWSKISISRIPMGQEINVTALQIVTAMSAVANGGNLMMPQIIRDVTDDEGNVVRALTPTVVRRVAGEEAIHAVRDALVQAVGPKGTAPLAHVAGFNVGGKTGTAQVIESKGHGYSHKRHRTSFVGFMPAEAPEFTCLVLLDEPETAANQDMGGLVCAPIFSRIAERSARYLGLTPAPESTPYGTALTQNDKPHAR